MNLPVCGICSGSGLVEKYIFRVPNNLAPFDAAPNFFKKEKEYYES